MNTKVESAPASSTDRLPRFLSDQTRWLVHRLAASYQHWLQRPLISEAAVGSELLAAIYFADFAVLSHGTEPDPLLNFGNAVALDLWEMSWDDFTRMPSRLTAEADRQEERQRVLHEVTTTGYSQGYRGIRVSRSGRRFSIEDATVWNVLDEQQRRIGQAAMFRTWSTLSP